jgi:hypothetical protein
MAEGKYSRVYLQVMTDPDFAGVWADDRILGRWLRMLLRADLTWPYRAPLPRQTAAVRYLIGAGLVIPDGLGGYTVRGLDAERERRSRAGSRAAAMRWQSGRIARSVPRTRQDEEDSADASANGAQGGTFMGWRDRPPKPGEHRGQHPDCLVCAPLRGEAEAPRPDRSPGASAAGDDT